MRLNPFPCGSLFNPHDMSGDNTGPLPIEPGLSERTDAELLELKRTRRGPFPTGAVIDVEVCRKCGRTWRTYGVVRTGSSAGSAALTDGPRCIP